MEAHGLALAIAKKTLEKNHFRTVQKTMDREPPSFKIGDRVYLKNNQANGTSNGDLDTGLSILSMMDITYTLKITLLEKTKSCNIKDVVQWNSGTSTHNLAELEDTSTILLAFQPSC